MRRNFANRLRSSSLTAVPPPRTSRDYSRELADTAASILYRSPLPSPAGLPVYVLNAAAFPDTHETDYDSLLPYVLARLPGEEELIEGREYEVVFFAGGDAGETSGRKGRPGWGWFVQAYNVLSRAMRKRLQKLYIVHERSWVRVLTEVFSTIVSPKFRRKIVHVSTLSSLALQIPIENVLIPPSAYMYDKRLSPDVYAPYVTGKRAFSARRPFPRDLEGNTRLPRVLRETSSFILFSENIVTEGLFRIPANSRLRTALREAYDRGQKFIIWKDNDCVLPIPRYRDVQGLSAIVREVDQQDAYNVHMAAALCKMWYAELRHPLFPQSCYRDLKSQFGNVDPQEDLSLDSIVEFIQPSSQWSSLPLTSREIMLRHLLPLLYRVSRRSEENKMTADNLATCFAPALLCGPDQIEDAKMSSIIRRLLAVSINAWENGLREGCGIDADQFERELQPPTRIDDYEDPLDEQPQRTNTQETAELGTSDQQYTGIIMEDKEGATRAQGLDADIPPLPPRPGAAGSGSSYQEDGTVRRRPAPPTVVPPRYSTVISDNPIDVSESPTSWAATTNGFAPSNQDHASRVNSGGLGSVDEKGELEKQTLGTVAASPLATTDNDGAASRSRASSSVSGMQPPDYAALTHMPKRKGLTMEQIERAPTISDETKAQNRSYPPPRKSSLVGPPQPAAQPLPGLVSATTGHEALRRKPVNHLSSSGLETKEVETRQFTTPLDDTSNTQTLAANTSSKDNHVFAKPDWPASARPTNKHQPTLITSLSRPVFPPPSPSSISNSPSPTSSAYPAFRRPSAPASSLAAPTTGIPKARSPSPGILKRMPSFESRGSSEVLGEGHIGGFGSAIGIGNKLPARAKTLGSGSGVGREVKKLDLKTSSVEGLKKLYEERAGLAEGLIGVGRGGARNG